MKDAFLTVKQREELYVLLDGAPYKVLRCLPGQQPAAAWWSDQLSNDLKEARCSMSVCIWERRTWCDGSRRSWTHGR